ncbi:MAG TPA: hypothetical protein PLD84_04375 [Chitinophagales bacterium]|nr:hypothetical protein [Chitinophagales bacterium]
MKKLLNLLPLVLVFSFFLSEMALAQVPGSSQIPGSGTNLNVPVVTNPIIATGSKGGAPSTIQLTPNPSNGQFSVRFFSAQGGKVAVGVSSTNGTGMIMLEWMAVAGNNVVPVDITLYGPGIYKVTVSGAGVYGTLPVTVR